MMNVKKSLRERIRVLHDRGLSNPEIASELKVDRVTAWRHTKDLAPVLLSKPKPTPSGQVIDWRGAQAGSVAVLREKASAGSVSAAASLARIASSEIRATPECQNHVDLREVHALLEAQLDLFRTTMLGAFARRICLLYDIPVAALEDAVHTAIESVVDEMNRRREAAIEATRSKENE